MTRKYYLISLMICNFAFFLFFTLNTNAETVTLNAGDKAPAFFANDDKGDLWELKEHLGKNFV